jgi:hypothetical protein
VPGGNKRRWLRRTTFTLLAGWAAATGWPMGPFAPGPGAAGSTAIDLYADEEGTRLNPQLIAWANAVVSYSPGANVSQTFQTPLAALGPANDTGFYQAGVDTIVTLGDGGSITLSFAQPIRDTDGFDLVIFENGITTTAGRGFFELAFVEVSSDGIQFHRFPARSTTPAPSSPYPFLELNPSALDGVAGKYPATYGTPFDFASLGITSVSQVRLVDILGDGQTLDFEGRPIYDPFPTSGSAGFDLDAVAAHVTQQFATWRQARFPWPENFTALSGPSADADADGCSNLMEYAFATLPTDPSSRRQPTLVRQGQEILLHLWRDPNKTDLRLAVEISSDLHSWSEVALSENGAPFQPLAQAPAGMTIQEIPTAEPLAVTLSIPAGAPRRFFRVSFAPISPP